MQNRSRNSGVFDGDDLRQVGTVNKRTSIRHFRADGLGDDRVSSTRRTLRSR